MARNVDPVKALEYLSAHYATAQRESLLKDVVLTDLEEQLEAANQRIQQLEDHIRQTEAAATNQDLPEAAAQ